MKQGQQDVEQRGSRGQASLDEGFQAMRHALEATNDREQGKRGLHGHAIIPGAFGTQLAVLWHAILAAKTVIGQDHAASAKLLDQRMKFVVGNIHGVPIPIDHLAEAVKNPAQLDPDAPAPFIFGLFAELLGTTPLANGKQQFNRETVDH